MSTEEEWESGETAALLTTMTKEERKKEVEELRRIEKEYAGWQQAYLLGAVVAVNNGHRVPRHPTLDEYDKDNGSR